MTFKSIIKDLFHRFASIDIIIEPEESAVREAVNKLKGGNPKYFDGVQKIVVEHGSPQSPYVGKSTGDGTVYISLDAIKNQLASAGLKDDQQALVNEILKTLGHEVAHIRGDMAPTETASEVEESVLEQRFPTPKRASLDKIAIDLTSDQKKVIQLRKEIRDLQDKLSNTHVVWKTLSQGGAEVDPARAAHFKAQQDKLNADIEAKRRELDALEQSQAPSIPQSGDKPPAQAPQQPQVTAPAGPDISYHKGVFEKAGLEFGQLGASLGELSQLLSGAPEFVRGEVKVLNRLRTLVGAVEMAGKKVTSRGRAGVGEAHLWNRTALERLLEEAGEAILKLADFLQSNSEFIKPLTNQGVEMQFYTSAIAPAVSKILKSLGAISALLVPAHRSILQIPDAPPPSTPAPELVRRERGPGKSAPKAHGERSLAKIREDYQAELAELEPKVEAVKSLLSSGDDRARVEALYKGVDGVNAELADKRQEYDRLTFEVESARGWRSDEGQHVKEPVPPESAAKLSSILDEISALIEKKRNLELQLTQSTNSKIDPDELIKVIAPHSSIDSLNRRIDLVKGKLAEFAELDKLKADLAAKMEEFKAAGPLSPEQTSEIEDLRNKVRDLEGELSSTSVPKGRDVSPEAARIRASAKESLKQISSPFVKSIFSRVFPDVVSGGQLRAKQKDLSRKVEVRSGGEDVPPEVEPQGKIGVIPTDAELATWQDQLRAIGRQIAARANSDVLDFIGRLGQAAESAISKTPAPMDILGPNILLKNYSKADGNKKIMRDLQSVVQVHLREVESLEREFAKVKTGIDEANKLATTNPDAANAAIERLRAKRNFLMSQPAYTKFVKEIGGTIDRIVQHAELVTPEPVVSAPPTVREKGVGERGPGDVVPPEKGEADPFKKEIDKWTSPGPEGRAAARSPLKQEIESGTVDISSVPKEVRNEMVSRLQANASELREIKVKLEEPDKMIKELDSEIDRLEKATGLEPEFSAKSLAQLNAKKDSILRQTERLRSRAREINSETGKIKDILRDPAKYLYDVPALEDSLDKQLEFQDNLTAKMHGIEESLKKLDSEMATASGPDRESLAKQHSDLKQQLADSQNAERATIERIKSIESRLRKAQQQIEARKPEDAKGVDRPAGKPAGEIRVFEPSEQEREKMREIRKRYEASVDRGVKEEAAKFQAADDATRKAMERRRAFVDPKNPGKRLPTTDMLRGGRAMRYAYKKAMELNPPDENRETEMRTALYRHQQIENYVRMLDDRYLKEAGERALSATDDVKEQYRLRAKFLDELHDGKEYTQATSMLKDALRDMDSAAIVTAPSGVAALKDVAVERDYGPGVGRTKGYSGPVTEGRGKKQRLRSRKPSEMAEPMLGTVDPYMLFFRAQYDAEQKLARYKEAEKAKKKLEAVRGKARERAMSEGKPEEEVQRAVDSEYQALLNSIMFNQSKLLSDFDTIVDNLSKASGQGKVPTPYFDPTKVQAYLMELQDAQAKLVREKELLRRYVQVREVPLVTAYNFDPDRFPKTMAVEFSDELPSVSEFARQANEGGEMYKSLRFVLPHVLYGYGKPKKKRKGEELKPTKEQESRLTETVKHKYHPAPIRPGGKMGPGETPKFMTQKIEPIGKK